MVIGDETVKLYDTKAIIINLLWRMFALITDTIWKERNIFLLYNNLKQNLRIVNIEKNMNFIMIRFQ